MAHVASQRFVFTQKRFFCVFSTILQFFHTFSNQKRRALKFCEDVSNFQPVNSDLRPFRGFSDDVGTKTTPAKVEVCVLLHYLPCLGQSMSTPPNKKQTCIQCKEEFEPYQDVLSLA